MTVSDDTVGEPMEGAAIARPVYKSAVQMAPSLRLEDLRLGYTGIRARLLAEHDHRFADFVIERDPQWTNVIHLIGMESPGLTAALSIAESVGAMVKESDLQ